jgi:HEAT repeat protein
MPAILFAAMLAAQQSDLRNADAVNRLLAALRTADPAVCEMAGRALTNQWGWGANLADEPMRMPMPTPMPVPMPMPFAGGGPGRSGRNVSYRASTSLDARVLAVFRTALRDQNHCVARIAARMVAREEPTWAAGEFGALAKDADAGVREVGLLGLGELEDPGTMDTMVNRLADRDANVRAMAAWRCGPSERSKAVARSRSSLPPCATAIAR